jgi:arginine decarboxylase
VVELFDYGLKYWANDNFIVDEGKLRINYANKPALIDMVTKIRDFGYKGPLLLRFPHLIKKQIDCLFNSFERSMKTFEYNGTFNAVFPLKVNQFPNFVLPLTDIAKSYNYGLEAGSKAELILAMAYNNKNAHITVNGFKDREMIKLGFLATKMGHNITLTIEGLSELETIIDVAKKSKPVPNIGLRIRLHSSGVGMWAKSGGINSKFGLTSSELVNAINMLKNANLLDRFTMIHFHIGSQITEIAPLKKALREAGNIYAELKKMGADALDNINIGGGLAVEYAQSSSNLQRNYTLDEFANDVVFLLKDIAASKNVKEPNIFTESGRFISSSHAVLIAPVLELFSGEYSEKLLNLKDENPPLIEELYDLYKTINKKNAREYLHDALDHLESLLTLFDLGYIDLEDRSNTEVLVHILIKKAIVLLSGENFEELANIQERLQERYLLNFSMFQSLPDFWGLGQSFPIMPIDRLDEQPTRSASLWDITCDSDGEIAFNKDNPLFLHDIDIENEDYFLGFFLVGAYQEVLGMRHNLFTHPTEAIIDFENNEYKITKLIESQTIMDVLYDLDYDIVDIKNRLKSKIIHSKLISDKSKENVLKELEVALNENGYLRNFQPNKQ